MLGEKYMFSSLEFFEMSNNLCHVTVGLSEVNHGFLVPSRRAEVHALDKTR